MQSGDRKRGRPKTGNSKDVTIRCRVTRELDEKLERYCEANHTTKSAVMIQGIEEALKK